MLAHSHKWALYCGSGFGRVLKLRHCECGVYETLMYDISKKALVWVPGNFFEDTSSPIFIVAEERTSLVEILSQLPTSEPYQWVRTSEDFEEMKKYRQPRWIPAKDWKETSISDTDEFRLLCATGHF